MKEKGVTGVFLGTLTTETASVMSEFRRLGMTPLVSTSWINQLPVAVKLAAPTGFEYLIPDYYTSTYEPAGQKLMALAKQYLGSDDYDNFNRFTISGYVGTQVLAEGIRRCGASVTRACVVAQLDKLHDFDTGGLTGPVSLDNPKGQAVLPVKLFQVDPKTATVKAITDFMKN
jgi:hypothetical protein